MRLCRHDPPLRLAAIALAATAGLWAVGCGHRGATIEATKIVQITHTDTLALPGQTIPAHTDTTVTWLAADRARREGGGEVYILRADTGNVLLIDTADRTYVDMSLDEASRMFGAMANAGPPAEANPGQRLVHGMVHVSAHVMDTGEDKVISGYHCHRYIVELKLGRLSTTSEQWVTRDVPIDLSLLRRASFATLVGAPGGDAAMAELAKVNGLPVRTVTLIEMLGRQGRSTTDLVSVRTGPVNAALFAAPPGYAARPPGPLSPPDTSASRAPGETP